MTSALAAERERLLPDTSGTIHDQRLDDGGERCFALATTTVDGRLSHTQDADVGFPIQSVVKPWIYGVALLDHGDGVHDLVGVEPTGEPFDAVVLEEGTGRPPNPMVNAGALLTSSLVAGRGVDERVARVLEVCSGAAGRALSVDEGVVATELEQGDRNRALGFLMRAGGTMSCSVEDALEVLARCCAITVTAADLATMAGTLATWGVRPGSSERVLPQSVVTDVLSVMATCGMYDGSGRWVHRAGLPAKSGVSGGVMAVAPGILGLGSYSPPLDDHGNSVRGLRAGEQLSVSWGLHPFGPPR
ncbi:glutaminase A [Nocardioides hwasunensis]|uniref:Glutaminase n=1 Tax=Nocardioides hwasunensis TaxID=397258 RepID=A0ABR8MCY6_9ACTN|nr:glutaminase A [Nocardioides hwasunensis]